MIKSFKIKIIIITGLLSGFFLNGCTPTYIPNVPNAPMFNNPGELQLNLNYGLSGFDPQVAFAFSDRFGVVANASFFTKYSDTLDPDYYHHRVFDVGLVYYKKYSKNFRFEVTGGLGRGRIETSLNFLTNNTLDMVNFNKVYIQPDIGFSSKIFDFAVFNRISVVNFKFDKFSNRNKALPFWEPGYIIRLGYHSFFLTNQIGLSIPLGGMPLELDYNPIMFSVGIQFKFNKKYESKPIY